MKLLPPLPLTFCSGGRFLFWECITIVEKHSFPNVERSFEKFCTCVTLVQRTELPNFTVSPRPQFKASLALSGITVVVLWMQPAKQRVIYRKLVVIIMNILTSRSLHYNVIKSIVSVIMVTAPSWELVIYDPRFLSRGADLSEQCESLRKIVQDGCWCLWFHFVRLMWPALYEIMMFYIL